MPVQDPCCVLEQRQLVGKRQWLQQQQQQHEQQQQQQQVRLLLCLVLDLSQQLFQLSQQQQQQQQQLVEREQEQHARATHSGHRQGALRIGFGDLRLECGEEEEDVISGSLNLRPRGLAASEKSPCLNLSSIQDHMTNSLLVEDFYREDYLKIATAFIFPIYS